MNIESDGVKGEWGHVTRLLGGFRVVVDTRGAVVHDVSDPIGRGAMIDFGTFVGGVLVGAFCMWMLRDYSLVRRKR